MMLCGSGKRKSESEGMEKCVYGCMFVGSLFVMHRRFYMREDIS